MSHTLSTQADLAGLAQQMLDYAQEAGADAADTMVVQGVSQTVTLRNGTLEQAERSEGTEIGLRVIIDQRQACVSAADLRPDMLRDMATRAVTMARLAPVDPTAGLADPDQLSPKRDATELELSDDSAAPLPAEMEEEARRAEAAARAISGITQVQSANAGYGHRNIFLAASNGFSGGYARSDYGLSCVAISGEGTGMERDYFGDGRIFRSDLIAPEDIGREAGMRAAARAGARKPKTGRYPVLFDERVSSTLIGHVLAAINGSAIARGSSWLRDAMGEAVLPRGFDLLEDPLRKRVGGSRPFDAEGLEARKRAFVSDGHLASWVLDLATARKLGMESTANAARGLTSPPSPSVGNLALIGPQLPRKALLQEMGTGLLVTALIGSSINPTTGDYSRGASGFWVQNGEITYAVNECTIAGNLREMLAGLRAADDARPHLSRVIPSLLVQEMTLAGA
ncbi:TldD/PmbA family protein [Rhodobacteraceae bacterium XHP0102]|nr:TldD/PmbA family protein [Rhodobacteraceae bacterium XHP0102]